ncbi:dTMP kinase [Rickettsia endosymbiont of Cardiosporidium cionae]|uniref:dTMP kinase n=1 Tax=Rickettsia endosymbiont of Cardiosporidium cionae TaxID=2777155 RepID=UPI0018939A62|nr:dTMP kinase [Rickettsia endosymbiont of Cardiosporidium cionae]KAF8818742.1 dTMP kinase [Rickettsia endosymbiont of Cardiosporidium cionae]
MIKLNNGPTFITIEGGQGSGKSTQSRLLYNYLLHHKVKAILTREIGGIDSGEDIRKLFLNYNFLKTSEIMLVMAARYEHIHKKVLPSLLSDISVICDRFVDSTACYNSDSSNGCFLLNKVYELHQELMKCNLDDLEISDSSYINTELYEKFNNQPVIPDITFLMDLDPLVAYRRVKCRIQNLGNVNRFDAQGIEYYKKIHSNFITIANLYPSRIIKIDCNDCSEEDIHQKILQHIML